VVKVQFKKVCKSSEIQNGEIKNILVEDKNVLLANINNIIFATSGQCTHEKVNLENGFLIGEDITCPLHLSKFNLKTGKALNPPATQELAIYNVKIQNEEIYIEID
jgi:nitrite reductase/ring-hydroxylating ferredoxin subunit|tara:strand:- start:272 stop:589 length:318 start_codon:yes stop_codon:yes gene_type:complete